MKEKNRIFEDQVPLNGSWQWYDGRNTISKHAADNRAQQIIRTASDITNRKGVEKALEECEKRYRSTLDDMMEGCQIIDFDWRYLFVNKALVVQAKQTEEAMLGRTMMEVYPGIEQTPLFAALQRSMTDRVAIQMENEFVYPDGSRGWFELRIQPVIEGIFILSFDITRRKLTEAALRQSEANLSAVFNNTFQAFILFDREKRVVARNPVADTWVREMLGRPLEIGTTVNELFGKFQKEIFHKSFARVLQGETVTRQIELTTPGGKFWFEVSQNPVITEGEGVVGVSMSVLNITERKKAEDALWQSEARYRSVVEDMPGLLCRFQPGGILEYVNDAYADAFDRKPEELLGQTFFTLIPEENRAQVKAGLDTLSPESPVMTHEHPVIAAGGERRWHRWSNRLLTGESGGTTAYQAFGLDITEQKKAEAALVENEQRFRALTEHAPDGVVIYGSSGRIEYASPATSRIMGYSLDELVSGDPAQFTHPDDLPGLLATLNELMQTPGKTITTYYRMRHKDGSWCCLESNISNFSHVPGIEGFVFNFRDITDSKQAQAELRRSEARYRAIVEDQTEVIIRTTVDGTILFVNEAYSRAFDSTPEALMGRNFLDFMDDEGRKKVHDKFSRLTPDNPVEVEEHQTILPDRRIIWARWTDRGIFDDNGRLQEVQAIGYDITDRRTAEDKLRQSEAQLQHIINTVPEGVLLLAADGSIRLTNPVADQYLTILQPEVEDGRLTHLGNQPLNKLLTSSSGDIGYDFIVNESAFEAIARPVENGSNDSGWVLVLRDITQERNIQQRVQRQDRLAAVGQLAAGIAHDFNNIMAVIILYAELILRKETMSPMGQEKLYTIEKQAQRATELIQQILDFSRQSVLERQLLDLLPFMKELVKLFQRTLPEHIQIELNHTGDEFLIHADLSRIQQVMMNLAVNARDAMPEGGLLQINLAHVHIEEHAELSIQDMPPGDWIQIQVTDSGSGIPTEVLPQIFEPFFTTKEVGQGTGLGLAQVYGIVQQHEGHIDVRTKVGQGTTFLLYFPALEPAGIAAATRHEVSLQQGQSQTVLVVEDEPSTREALVSSLLFLNYEIVEAANGREALAILETKADSIDLVLSDVVMPEMGGIALLHAMRKLQLKTLLVLLTGHPQSDEVENLKVFGLAGWLSKPPGLVNLSNVLTQVLASTNRHQ